MPGLRSPLAIVGAFTAVLATACVPPAPTTAPNLTVTTIAGPLDHPWDVDWLPDRTLLFNQRTAGIFALKGGAPVQLSAGGPDFWASGETGMMGLAVDPRFVTNRRIYTCQGSTDDSPIGGHANSVKVVTWQLDAAVTVATKVRDVVTGIDATSGRHGGCRLEFTPDHALWVTTGDAAFGTNPQNIGSLNGKVLRVNPDGTNAPWPGNPFGTSPNGRARLVYTYGHRNVQGIARRADGTMWTAEHGPDRDDEVNVLIAGANYGWNPVPGYNERVPMTDTRLPNVQGARWSSGIPTVATSGMTWLRGTKWGPWNGALAVAALKEGRLHIQFYTDTRFFRGQQLPAKFNHTFGRLRTAQQGPDGCLYVLTDNGLSDRIIRACPG
jgi:glucose/arabinose dehydrogenase